MPSLPVLADRRRSLLSIAGEGKGRVLLLASSGPLQNEHLAQADNARLGIALAGAPTRRVVFAESYHGYGTSSGLGAIPWAWKVTLSLGSAGGNRPDGRPGSPLRATRARCA